MFKYALRIFSVTLAIFSFFFVFEYNSSLQAAITYHGVAYVEDNTENLDYSYDIKGWSNLVFMLWHPWRGETISKDSLDDVRNNGLKIELELVMWEEQLIDRDARIAYLEKFKKETAMAGLTMDDIAYVRVYEEWYYQIMDESNRGNCQICGWKTFQGLNQAERAAKLTPLLTDLISDVKTYFPGKPVGIAEHYWSFSQGFTFPSNIDYITIWAFVDTSSNTSEMVSPTCDEAGRVGLRNFLIGPDGSSGAIGAAASLGKPVIVYGRAFGRVWWPGAPYYDIPPKCFYQWTADATKDFKRADGVNPVQALMWHYYDLGSDSHTTSGYSLKYFPDHIVELAKVGYGITSKPSDWQNSASVWIRPRIIDANTSTSVQVNWKNILTPIESDWIGIYPVGSNTYVTWFYNSSCSQTKGSQKKSSGVCTVNIPGPGKYEARLNNYNVFIGTSNSLFAIGNPTLKTSATSLNVGSLAEVKWDDVVNPSESDIIALYESGKSNGKYEDWWWSASCAKVLRNSTNQPIDSYGFPIYPQFSGSCKFNMSYAPGTYEFRLHKNNSSITAATSETLTLKSTVNFPTIVISDPQNGALVNSSTVRIRATANDSDGSISKVEFYNGSTKLFDDTVFPYEYQWTSVPEGTHFVSAKAYDNVGLSTVSNIVSITVKVSSVTPGGGGGDTNVVVPPPSGGGGTVVSPTNGSGTNLSVDNQVQIDLLLSVLRALITEAKNRGIYISPALESYLDQNSTSAFGSLSYGFSRNLTIGSRGQEVTFLQQFIISKNKGPVSRELSLVGATGYFGPLTARALAEYQKNVGIAPAVGYFGPLTRNHVNSNQ